MKGKQVAVVVGATSKWQADGRNTKPLIGVPTAEHEKQLAVLENARTAARGQLAAAEKALPAIEDALLHRTGDGYQLAAINLSFGGGAFGATMARTSPAPPSQRIT